jgi:hypothetical protein
MEEPAPEATCMLLVLPSDTLLAVLRHLPAGSLAALACCCRGFTSPRSELGGHGIAAAAAADAVAGRLQARAARGGTPAESPLWLASLLERPPPALAAGGEASYLPDDDGRLMWCGRDSVVGARQNQPVPLVFNQFKGGGGPRPLPARGDFHAALPHTAAPLERAAAGTRGTADRPPWHAPAPAVGAERCHAWSQSAVQPAVHAVAAGRCAAPGWPELCDLAQSLAENPY